MNDQLIYTFVRGQGYRAMLDTCLGSLRTLGRFSGDIMIFSPDLCPVIQAVCDKWHAYPRVIDWQNPQMVDRVYALRHLEVAVYSSVTCMDADVIACRPVSAVLADDRYMRYCEENWQTYETQPAPMYIEAMSQLQRQAVAKMHPVNVGLITWPSWMHGTVMAEWIRLVETRDWRLGFPWGWDQASYNYLVRCGELEGCAIPYGPFEIANATKVPQDEWTKYAFVHYAGHRDKLKFMQETMARARWPGDTGSIAAQLEVP
jgi:hypothetical protein